MTSSDHPSRCQNPFSFRTIQRCWLLVVWMVLNGCLFLNTYFQYKNLPEYMYLRTILGAGLCVSRASATIITINCCLVLLPKCRLIHSLLCSAVVGRHFLLYWLQHSKTFHITVSFTIVFFSVVHSTAHVQNAINFSAFYDEEHEELNWAAYKGEHPCRIVFRSLTGSSGAAMLLLVSAVAITSCRIVRRTRYNVFWYTHQMSYLFLLLFLIHPFRMSVDGPFHSPLEGLLNVKFACCIAGGVGITSFMAALYHFMSDPSRAPSALRLVWVVRNVQQVQWCARLLLAYHSKCWYANEPDRFSFNIYVTHGDVSYRPILDQVLMHRVHAGRPRWQEVFSVWNQWGQNDKYVFTCGPKKLTKEIRGMSQQFKSFHFVHESFS